MSGITALMAKYAKLTLGIIHTIFLFCLIRRERDHWGDQDVDRRIILRWILRKWEGVVGTGLSWLRIGMGGGHL